MMERPEPILDAWGREYDVAGDLAARQARDDRHAEMNPHRTSPTSDATCTTCHRVTSRDPLKCRIVYPDRCPKEARND